MINPNPCPMNSAKLVEHQRRQQFYFMAVVVLIVILTTFFFNLNTISISVLGTICIPIVQLWQLKKYHLNYDSNRIDWFCSNTNENKSIDLSEEKYLTVIGVAFTSKVKGKSSASPWIMWEVKTGKMY